MIQVMTRVERDQHANNTDHHPEKGGQTVHAKGKVQTEGRHPGPFHQQRPVHGGVFRQETDRDGGNDRKGEGQPAGALAPPTAQAQEQGHGEDGQRDREEQTGGHHLAQR